MNGFKFFRQYSVGHYILDFYCPAGKIAIEIDGGQHTFEENRQTDAERTRYLSGQKIKVLRFWNHEVLQQLEAVVAKIEEEMLNHSR